MLAGFDVDFVHLQKYQLIGERLLNMTINVGFRNYLPTVCKIISCYFDRGECEAISFEHEAADVRCATAATTATVAIATIAASATSRLVERSD